MDEETFCSPLPFIHWGGVIVADKHGHQQHVFMTLSVMWCSKLCEDTVEEDSLSLKLFLCRSYILQFSLAVFLQSRPLIALSVWSHGLGQKNG